MSNHLTRYSEAEKFQAVALYVSLGSLTAVAKELAYPYETLKDWKAKDWWKQYERAIKSEENAALSAKFRKIVKKVQEQILDRLEDGDHVVLKDGSVIRVPVKAKELAIIGAVSTDKIIGLDSIQEHREETVSIEQRLNLIAEELKQMSYNKGRKSKPDIIDVEPIASNA